MLLKMQTAGIVPLIGLDWKDDDGEARALLDGARQPLRDRRGRPRRAATAIDWGVYGAPETFLVNPQGIVVYKHVGALTQEVWQQEILPRAADGQDRGIAELADVARAVSSSCSPHGRALLGAAAAYAIDADADADPQLQARYLALTHELRCMQCQNESLADSPVDLAADLRAGARHAARRQDATSRSATTWWRATATSSCSGRAFIARTAWLWLRPGRAAARRCWSCAGRHAPARRAARRRSDPDDEDAADLMIVFVVLAAALTAAVRGLIAVPLLQAARSAGRQPAPWTALAAAGCWSSARRCYTSLEQLVVARARRRRLPADMVARLARQLEDDPRRSRRLADARTLLRACWRNIPLAVRAFERADRLSGGSERRGAHRGGGGAGADRSTSSTAGPAG